LKGLVSLKRLAGLALIILTVALLNSRARAQQSQPADLSPEERAFVAAKVYQYVTTYFAHRRASPVADFDAAFKQYLSRALKAGGRVGFDLATMELVASLGNGHTQFVDRALFSPPWLYEGIGVRYVGGRWIVLDSQTEGVRRGDEIVAVDGRPVEKFFEERRRYIAASDERAARRKLFVNAHLFPERFTLTLDGDRNVTVDRRTRPADEPEPQTEGRRLRQNDVAYIKIPSFGVPRFQEGALRFVREFASARALIIDVRGNGGGSTPSELLKALMTKPYRRWTESTPQTLAVLKYRGQYADDTMMTWTGGTTQPDSPVFKGRLVILADAACGSACEDFVMPFKDNGRATIVGETTGGSTGQPYVYDFGNGMLLLVSSVRETFPDGSEFEGVGIRPDVEVPLTAEEIKSGADSALARAIEEAAKPGR
jgi:carboxyl-terminal processing protease